MITRKFQPNHGKYTLQNSPLHSNRFSHWTKSPALSAQKPNLSSAVQHTDLLMAKATVQGSQVQGGVSQTPAITLIPIAFAFCSGENQTVKIMQEAVS